LDTKFHVRVIDQIPDPQILARRIAHLPGAVLLSSRTKDPCAYLSCEPIETRVGLDPEPSVRIGALPPTIGGFPRWIGLLPYEAFRGHERRARNSSQDDRPEPLVTNPRWWRYGAIAEVTSEVKIIGDDPECVRILAERLQTDAAEPRQIRFELKPGTEQAVHHERRIISALSHIADGDVYQVNLARRIDLVVRGHALDWLEHMGSIAPASFGFALEVGDLRIAGTSPELCLAVSPNGRLLTRPIKGTRPRGASRTEDEELILQLSTDPKEIAELSMVIDLERNDLSRVSTLGSIQVLSDGVVETFGTVHHRVASVVSRLRPEVTRSELLNAFMPSGSVTGTPKIRAMELIASLEQSRRGLYTGAYGWIGHDGSLRLGMAIRTVVANRSGEGVYFAGGGIVADSIPKLEVEETEWKALQIFRNSFDGAPGVTPPRSEQRPSCAGWSFAGDPD